MNILVVVANIFMDVFTIVAYFAFLYVTFIITLTGLKGKDWVQATFAAAIFLYFISMGVVAFGGLLK